VFWKVGTCNGQVGAIFLEFPQPKDPSSVLLCLFRSLKISRKAVVFQIYLFFKSRKCKLLGLSKLHPFRVHCCHSIMSMQLFWKDGFIFAIRWRMKLNGRCQGRGNPKVKRALVPVVAELSPADFMPIPSYT
jgi:hypothetical protein